MKISNFFITLFLLISLSQQTNNLFAETLSNLVKYEKGNPNSFWFDTDLSKYEKTIKESSKEDIKKILDILAKNYFKYHVEVDIEEMYGQSTKPNISRESFESRVKMSYNTENIIKTIEIIKHIINNCLLKFNAYEFNELKKQILESALSKMSKDNDPQGKIYLKLFNFLKPDKT